MLTRKLISFDWAIKKILRSKANFGILEGFLSELLFTDITILEVLESESNQETGYDKYNRVDIKVRDGSQRIIIIEVQYSREMDYLQRILFGSSKVITEHLKKNAAYSDVSKVISVNILYFNFGEEEDYIYYGTTNFVGMHNQSILELTEEQKRLYAATSIADLYPEYYLIEIRNFNDIAKNSLDEWIYFLKNEEIEDDFSAKGLNQAKEILDVLNMNKEERQAYEHHQKQLHHEASLYESTYVLGMEKGMDKGMEKGRKEGKEEGRKEGKEEGRKEGKEEGRKEGILLTGKNMKQAGIPIQTIGDVTGLSIEQIENL